jgi:hypothetical protein
MEEETKSVYDVDLVPKRLLTSDYYKDQLTLLLRNSYGVPEQIDLYVKILNVINTRLHDIFNALGTYNSSDKHWHINIEAINKISTTESDLLDKIAEIVGCSRYYSFLNQPLNNTELYILIRFRIMQNNFMGTYEELSQIYKKFIKDTEYSDFEIDYYTSNEEPLTCIVALNMDNIIKDDGTVKDEYQNLYLLFQHDLLLVKSLGVTYNKLYETKSSMAFFDKYPTSIDEDTGEITYDTNSDHCKFDTAKFC